MQVTVEIPDQFVSQLVPAGCSPSRILLEEAVAGAYRERRLTMEQVRQLLGFGTRMQVDSFLQQHEIYDYTIDEFEKDMLTLERLFPFSPASEHPRASGLPDRTGTAPETWISIFSKHRSSHARAL